MSWATRPPLRANSHVVYVWDDPTNPNALPPDVELPEPPTRGDSANTEKETAHMTNSDFSQQVIRILLWIGTPLLAKWGIDSGSATAMLTGFGGFIATAIWWFFWNRKKTA